MRKCADGGTTKTARHIGKRRAAWQRKHVLQSLDEAYCWKRIVALRYYKEEKRVASALEKNTQYGMRLACHSIRPNELPTTTTSGRAATAQQQLN